VVDYRRGGVLILVALLSSLTVSETIRYTLGALRGVKPKRRRVIIPAGLNRYYGDSLPTSHQNKGELFEMENLLEAQSRKVTL
jgi:hypothetical protein